MDDIPALLHQGDYSTAMKATPDNPVIFEKYWNAQKEQNYVANLIRHDKHRIVRYLLDKPNTFLGRLGTLCYYASSRFFGLRLAGMHVLDKYPQYHEDKNQKTFCKVRTQCRKIALVVLHAGKLKKALRDVLLIIARIVWGMRGYCEFETEIIKIKRLCM